MQPIDYLKSDIAARYGLDKEPFNKRIQFVNDNIDSLEDFALEAKEPILFNLAVQALRQYENDEPITYGVSFDASASGMQLLSILTGDKYGAYISNVVNDEEGGLRDPYVKVHEVMEAMLGLNQTVDREDLKQAIMCALYGSEAEPAKLFYAEVLEAFYKSMETTLPNCWALNTFLINFQKTSQATSYDWIMPDNFHVFTPVKEKVEDYVECLGSYHLVNYKVARAHSNNRSLGANTIHSIESFIIRELIRRCNFEKYYDIVDMLNHTRYVEVSKEDNKMFYRLMGLYERSGMLSIRILDYISSETINVLGVEKVEYLLESTANETFPIKCIHDCVFVHPNYAHELLRVYREIFAQVHESNMLEFILKQSIHEEFTVTKGDSFADKIRESTYILN